MSAGGVHEVHALEASTDQTSDLVLVEGDRVEAFYGGAWRPAKATRLGTVAEPWPRVGVLIDGFHHTVSLPAPLVREPIGLDGPPAATYADVQRVRHAGDPNRWTAEVAAPGWDTTCVTFTDADGVSFTLPTTSADRARSLAAQVNR